MSDQATYDVVFLSTGLVESVAAAALAVAGKKVLQVDSSDRYGSSWSTVSPDRLGSPVDSATNQVDRVELNGRGLYVDLNPRLAYADGPLISLLLASGAHNYTEFTFCKAVVWCDEGEGRFASVAASRGDVFKDTSLSLSQKHSLVRALRELTEGPERPWREVFHNLGLEEEVVDRFVHGVCLSDGEEGVDRRGRALLMTYGRSLGKYAATRPGGCSSPFLYPKYGTGELCSAFSRRAAVSGAVQMLRCEARVVGAPDVGPFEVCIRSEDGAERYISTTAVVGRGVPSDEFVSKKIGNMDKGRDNHATGMARCVALVSGQVIDEEGPCLAAFPRASSSGRVIWMLQLDKSSGCCDLDGHTLVQLWTVPACGARSPGDPTPGPAMDEFREILRRHFDCSLVSFSNDEDDRARDNHAAHLPGSPRIQVLWAWHDDARATGTRGSDEARWVKETGVITEYDGDLARDGLISYAGLAEEAERVFRLACGDDDAVFPFGDGTRPGVGATDAGRDAVDESVGRNELADELLDEMDEMAELLDNHGFF